MEEEQEVTQARVVPLHDGDLGHNATVMYVNSLYSTSGGEPFTLEEVSISDKMRHVLLTPKEALSLLDWLKQEELNLHRLTREQ
jgi:hypothetical protein